MIKGTLFSVWVLFLTVVMAGIAQVPDKETILKYVSNANAGTEFWLTFPPSYEEVAGAENTIRLFVSSPVRQPITVEVPAKGFSMTKMAIANDVIEFKLPSAIAQAYSKPSQGKAPPEKVYEKCGVHVVAQSPIVVYGITRFQYTSDGFLAIPVSKLGSDYIIASWPQYTAVGGGYKLPAISNIVAAYDNTKVTFTMGGTKDSRTTGGLKIGQSQVWILNAGDVLCFANDDDGQDIAGSLVVSDKPIGIVSGNQCANVPAGVPWCDFIDEMELPIKTWGKEYHVTPIVERLYNPVIRVFAHPNYKNVKVYRDGILWKTLSNESRVEGEAFFEARAYDGAPRSTIISADAPIYVMLYNTGQADDNVSSDPFQMVLTPIEQYQKEIAFGTPNAKGSTLPFTRNFVNIVYAMADGNTIPQDLEFGAVKDGQIEWRTVSSRFGAGPGQIFAIKSSNGEQYAMKRIQLPNDGVFRMRAAKPFAAYAYGFSDYDSYGFPTSASVLDASILDTIPPIITVAKTEKGIWSGTTEDLYNRIVGAKADDKAANNNGTIASVCLLADSSENVSLKVEKSAMYKTEPVKWSLTVTDMSKSAKAIVIVTDNFRNYTYKGFNYSPSGIVMKYENSTPLFCNLSISEQDARTLTLQNISSDKETEITECTISDTNNFKIDRSKIIGTIIDKQAQIDIPTVFVPKSVGNYSAIISVKTKTNDSATVEIVAKAMQTLLKTDETISFDTTLIENISDNDRKFTMISEIGAFNLPATVVDIRSMPIDGVSFENGKYGSEGFQINKSTFINKIIDEKINNKIEVPVKFKAVKEGLHQATAFFYITKDKSVESIELIGYGKKTVSSVNENNNTEISIYTNVTQNEIVVQGDAIQTIKSYSIINQLGETVLSGTIPEGVTSYSIPYNNVPAGMYTFTTQINGKNVQEKFVVVR